MQELELVQTIGINGVFVVIAGKWVLEAIKSRNGKNPTHRLGDQLIDLQTHFDRQHTTLRELLQDQSTRTIESQQQLRDAIAENTSVIRDLGRRIKGASGD
tara:strand:+ start:263 stop:565 length:303 start_codon:yes stop_codon:yes gene_type:complete